MDHAKSLFNPLVIPNSVLQSKQFSLPTKIVFSYLLWLFSHESKQDMSPQSIAYISKTLNIKEFHITATLKQLEKYKLIKWVPNNYVEVL